MLQESDPAAEAEVLPMPVALLSARLDFLRPPAPAAAHRAWYLGRVLEALAQTLFGEEVPAEGVGEARRMRPQVERMVRVR